MTIIHYVVGRPNKPVAKFDKYEDAVKAFEKFGGVITKETITITTEVLRAEEKYINRG